MYNEPIIICGFSGIGKSALARNRGDILDLESSEFSETEYTLSGLVKRNENFPDNYIQTLDTIIDNNTKFKYILMSCHASVRQALQRAGHDYVVAMPAGEGIRDEYIRRWTQRGSSFQFTDRMSQNWDKMICSCWTDDAPKLFIKHDHYLSHIISLLESEGDDVCIVKAKLNCFDERAKLLIAQGYADDEIANLLQCNSDRIVGIRQRILRKEKINGKNSSREL